MDISSKICVENNIAILFELKNGLLYYDLKCEGDYDVISIYKMFIAYKQIDTNNGLFNYNNVSYNKIKHNAIEKNKKLKEGNYLFIFNRTKIFVTFTGNKISYELEDVGIICDMDNNAIL